MDANTPITAYLGSADRDFGVMMYDPYQKMLTRERMAGDETRTAWAYDTQWYLESVLAAQMRTRAEEEPVCGAEPEVVEDYLAWLSDGQLRELEVLDANRRKLEEQRRARTQPEGKGGLRAECTAAADERARGDARDEVADAGADAWLAQADHAMEVWSDIFGTMVDHANGISREERTQRSEQFYAEWDGCPPCLEYAAW